ncbi:hypothetical protein QTP88_025821 [Uroleucon formosanum]
MRRFFVAAHRIRHHTENIKLTFVLKVRFYDELCFYNEFGGDASEDLLWPSDFKRCSGNVANNLGSKYKQYSVIVCLIVRQVPYNGVRAESLPQGEAITITQRVGLNSNVHQVMPTKYINEFQRVCVWIQELIVCMN